MCDTVCFVRNGGLMFVLGATPSSLTYTSVSDGLVDCNVVVLAPSQWMQ